MHINIKAKKKVKKRLKKKVIISLLATIISLSLMLLTACNVKNIDTEKIRDLDYVILEEEHIPEEVYEQIVNDMDEFCRKAYVCSGVLYIVVCYGAQPTAGYSIQVDYLYESSNAILVETTLKGPAGMDKVEQVITYPYIVLKVENIDKTVVFN